MADNNKNENLDPKPEGFIESIKHTGEDISDSIKETGSEIADSIKEKKDEIKASIKKMDEKMDKQIEVGVKKTKSFFKKLMIGLLILGILSLIGYMLYANFTYSEGTRAGDLIKISKKGYVFKTYEGQLKLGGIDLTSEDGLSDTWEFSATDEAVIEQLQKLQGEKVILHYKEINKAMPWQGDTEYFITKVER